jgi:ketosteroid isomerase-like protein
MTHPRDEVEAAVRRYLDMRERIDDGDESWDALAGVFTDDVVYVDPAWGRVEGLEAVRRELLGDAMEGLRSWRFPVDFHLIEGDTVVIKWRQVIPGPDGRTYEQSGYSTLVYAGGGKFRYEEDLLNMAHVMEDLRTSGWRPPHGVRMHAPPEFPERDFSIPDRTA